MESEHLAVPCAWGLVVHLQGSHSNLQGVGGSGRCAEEVLLPHCCLVWWCSCMPCRTIYKLFDVDHKEYRGTVQDVDTEVDTGDGTVVEGLFFRIL